MPEKVTKEEKIVDLAIKKARKTIETLRESTQVIPYDSTVEVQKIKRPKVQDASKITNQTQEKEGYGLAGESLKKSMVLKFDDEMALNGENVREANSLAPRFVGPHFSINLKRDEITKVLKEFNKKYSNVRLSKVTNGDEYISAFVNLAAYLYPKNVGRTFSNIGESQFKKSDNSCLFLLKRIKILPKRLYVFLRKQESLIYLLAPTPKNMGIGGVKQLMTLEKSMNN